MIRIGHGFVYHGIVIRLHVLAVGLGIIGKIMNNLFTDYSLLRKGVVLIERLILKAIMRLSNEVKNLFVANRV